LTSRRLGTFTALVGLAWSSALVWFLLIQVMRLALKAFLSYKGWMYEDTSKVPYTYSSSKEYCRASRT